MHERRAKIAERPGQVDEILAAGSAALKPKARETMLETRERLGIPSSDRYR